MEAVHHQLNITQPSTKPPMQEPEKPYAESKRPDCKGNTYPRTSLMKCPEEWDSPETGNRLGLPGAGRVGNGEELPLSTDFFESLGSALELDRGDGYTTL